MRIAGRYVAMPSSAGMGRATGLHAFHLSVGIGLLAMLVWRIHWRSLPRPDRAVTVETCGLYWHLVDIVWIFLYPALYLAR